MKRIRKAVNNAVIALIAVSVLLCAASCMVPVGENYELHTEEDTVTEIVIYDRSGSRSDDLPYNSAGENEEPVAAVAAEKFEEFCTEFKKITEFKAKMIIVAPILNTLSVRKSERSMSTACGSCTSSFAFERR